MRIIHAGLQLIEHWETGAKARPKFAMLRKSLTHPRVIVPPQYFYVRLFLAWWCVLGYSFTKFSRVYFACNICLCHPSFHHLFHISNPQGISVHGCSILFTHAASARLLLSGAKRGVPFGMPSTSVSSGKNYFHPSLRLFFFLILYRCVWVWVWVWVCVCVLGGVVMLIWGWVVWASSNASLVTHTLQLIPRRGLEVFSIGVWYFELLGPLLLLRYILHLIHHMNSSACFYHSHNLITSVQFFQRKCVC